MQKQEKLTGVVERFLFQSSENGFTVFVLSTKNASTIVKGSLPHIQAGQEVELEGAWVFHKKFGKQFHAEKCISRLPSSVVGLKKYLGSGLIKGIGKTYADKLVNYFGTDILDIIDQHPERLKEVAGIGQKRIETISNAWHDQKEVANIMIFLQEKDVSPAYAAKIYKKYGQESIAVLNENPYRLADEIWGIGFKIADTIAQKLGFAPDCAQRLAAGITFALTSGAGSGHLYLELENLRTKTIELLGLTEHDKPLLKKSLHALYNKEKIKLISKDISKDYADHDQHARTHFIGLTKHYLTELNVAKRLGELISHPSHLNFDIEKIYQSLRVEDNPQEPSLNELQQKGILATLQNKVTIITGGPGTGKTTLIKKLLSILDSNKVTYKLAAPTGRAAKRIMEGTGKYAATIHRLLEFDVSTMSFVHNENNALKLDYLIVDEASMIDIFLAYSIVRALPLNAHLILIGDIDQLPSVGPGNFLKDLIATPEITSIQLTEIFRQAADSMIVVNAHKVNHGEFPSSASESSKKDFKFFKETNPENCINHIKRALFIECPKLGINPHKAQILVPMNRGVVGTQNLNHHLQEMLNPAIKPALQRAGLSYKEGDKVMQIRNNYDKNVFNGDIGSIETVNQEDRELTVQFGERIVEYESNELDELVLAYATTIHKSQGSEYSAVIIPIFMQHFTLLQRNLIYTAITRAKKLCILIGEPRAIAMAIKNNKTIKRITFLQDFLAEILK